MTRVNVLVVLALLTYVGARFTVGNAATAFVAGSRSEISGGLVERTTRQKGYTNQYSRGSKQVPATPTPSNSLTCSQKEATTLEYPSVRPTADFYEASVAELRHSCSPWRYCNQTAANNKSSIPVTDSLSWSSPSVWYISVEAGKKKKKSANENF